MTIAEEVKGASDDPKERLLLILKHFGCDSGTIHTLSAEDGNLHLVATGPGMPEAVLAKIQVIPVGKGMAGLCVERNAPVNSCNIQQDTTGDVRPGALQTGLQGSMVVPIRDAKGNATGALGVASMRERTFSEEEVAELAECAQVFA